MVSPFSPPLGGLPFAPFAKGGSALPLLALSFFHLSNHIHLYQSLPRRIKRPTTPRPIPRMRHEFLHHWIRMHVFDLLPHLFPRIHIEIVIPPLPEAPQFSLAISRPRSHLLQRCGFLPAHKPGNPLLEDLHHFRRRRRLCLPNHQVHVLRHDHIPRQRETIFGPHLSQNLHREIARPSRFQQCPAVVATESDEVQVLASRHPPEICRHKKRAERTHPLQNQQRVGHPLLSLLSLLDYFIK